MLDQVLFAATVLALLGSAMISGVFFSFSSFILTALSRIPAANAIAAMQAMTSAIKGPLFLVLFFGTAALAGVLGIAAPIKWSEAGSGYLLLGSLLFLNGPFGVTLLKNVPLNNKLAAMSPKSQAASRFWDEFRPVWGLWNHVRWIGSLAAAASFLMALVEGGAPLPARD